VLSVGGPIEEEADSESDGDDTCAQEEGENEYYDDDDDGEEGTEGSLSDDYYEPGMDRRQRQPAGARGRGRSGRGAAGRRSGATVRKLVTQCWSAWLYLDSFSALVPCQ